MYIFVNNNTYLNFLKILSNYTIWDRFSQKPSHATVPLKANNYSRREQPVENSLGTEAKKLKIKHNILCTFDIVLVKLMHSYILGKLIFLSSIKTQKTDTK